MKFLEHIRKIDDIVEARKEDEQMKTIFAGEASAASGIGLGAISTRPNIHGGVDVHDDERRVGYTQPNIFGGQTYHQW